ncbi:MAG: hypothetical protein JW836_14810 [Deltaproteobacteria bacterium]|nr:hypothetical protein [Deltaproteobacteria bacterium]
MRPDGGDPDPMIRDYLRRLIRRWDCAPHFPSLTGFPHHIHVGREDAVLPGRTMNGLGVLAELDKELSKA